MTRSTSIGRVATGAGALALFLASCAPAPPPGPTTTPNKPAATSAPAMPTATTAPAEPAASPTAPTKPAASPTVKTEGKPAAAPPTNVAASPQVAAKGEPLNGSIKIVSSLPRTGSSKGQTDTMVAAIKLALQETNNKIGNASVTYQDLDDATPARGAWDAGKEAENARTAAADKDILLYLGTFNSGAAKVSIPILNRAGPLAMISAVNTFPGLTKQIEGLTEANEPDAYYPAGKRNYFRVVPTDELQGVVGAGFAKEAGATKVYVLDDTETFGYGIARTFVNTAKRIGLNVVGGTEGIDPKASDYRSLAQKIKDTGADLVYFGGITTNNAGKLFQDIKAAIPRVKMMGADGIFDQAFIEAAGQAAEGTFITFGAVPPEKLTGTGADFVKKYKDTYKSDPEAYTAYAYESARVGIRAIQDCGAKDRACVVDALSKVKNYGGILGNWSFTDTGDTTLTRMSIDTVKNRRWEFVKTQEAP